MPVLAEGTDPPARMLWMLVRATDLRTSSAEAFFQPGAFHRQVDAILDSDLPDELEASLLDAARIYRVLPPGRDVEAAALSRLGAWAERDGRGVTALACYEAAARISPGDPERSLIAARAARDLREWTRADRWYDRAVLLARRQQRWDCYVRSLDSRGVMDYRRGRFERSERLLGRALSRARRERLRESRALAAHDLMGVITRGFRLSRVPLAERVRLRAESLAEEAFWAYGPEHHLIYRLAHDTAQLLALGWDWSEALPIFEATVRKAESDRDRAAGWAGVLWTSGHLGDRTRFRKAAPHVEEAADLGLLPATFLAEAAEGAAAMEDWRLAERFVREGLAVAELYDDEHARLELWEQRRTIMARAVREPARSGTPRRPWVDDLRAALELRAA